MNYLTALFFAADAVMKMVAQGVLFTPTAYFQVLPTVIYSLSEGLFRSSKELARRIKAEGMLAKQRKGTTVGCILTAHHRSEQL
jgi:hypothetical protein